MARTDTLQSVDVTHADLDLHQLMLSRSKLKSTVRTSTLLAGFAIVAMVEVELDDKHSNGLLIPFAIITSILIFVHMLALVMATYMLPELDALASIPRVQLTRRPMNIARGVCVKITWFLSHVLGIFFFLAEFVLLAFVKFYPSNEETKYRYQAGIAAGAVMILLSISATLIALCYYRFSYIHRNVRHQREALEQAENILQQLKNENPAIEVHKMDTQV